MPQVPVCLISDDPQWLQGMRRVLAPVEDLAVVGQRDLSGLKAEPDGIAGPAVLLVDAGAALETALEAIAQSSRRTPGSAAILCLRPGLGASAVYPQAALAGARLVLEADAVAAEVTEAIYQAAAHLGAAPSQDSAPAGGQVVLLFGTKGGVGKTTLAVNLAVALAARGLRAALWDLHLDWGNAAVLLRLTAPRPLTELLGEAARLDGDLLQSFMVRHASGLYLLPAPPKPEVAEFVTAAHTAAILRAAREQFEVLILDYPAGFPDALQPALEGADRLLVLTTPELPALRSTRAALRVLELLPAPQPGIHLVLTQADAGAGVRPADVEATLGLPLWARIPYDPLLTRRSANEGIPAVQLAPASRWAQAVQAVAQRLLPAPAGPPGGGRGRRPALPPQPARAAARS